MYALLEGLQADKQLSRLDKALRDGGVRQVSAALFHLLGALSSKMEATNLDEFSNILRKAQREVNKASGKM